VALVLLGVLVVVWLVDPNLFKPRIEAAVREATGREFALGGDIELGFFPWLALRTGAGQLGNAPGFGSEPMVTWKSAQLGARLFPLLRGELIAERVKLDGLDIRLVRHADGHANWEGLTSDQPADAAAPQTALRIAGVTIVDSHLLFRDELVPRRVEIASLQLTTDTIEPGKPLTDTAVAGILHLEGFVPAGVPFKLAVPKAELPRDFSAIDVPAFSMGFGAFEAAGSVSATLGEKPKAFGKIASNEFAPRALLTSVGIAPPETTDANALSKLRFSGTWGFEDGAVRIDPFTLLLDDTHFSGKFARAAGEDPVGEFTLHGDLLDLSRYVPPTDPNSEPFVLPTAMLKALKFRGVIELDRAKFDDIAMQGVTLRLLLDEQGLHGEQHP